MTYFARSLLSSILVLIFKIVLLIFIQTSLIPSFFLSLSLYIYIYIEREREKESGPGSDGNEGVLGIPQSSSIAGTSPSDCLVSYAGHSLVGALTPLQRSSRCILQPQPTGQSYVGV